MVECFDYCQKIAFSLVFFKILVLSLFAKFLDDPNAVGFVIEVIKELIDDREQSIMLLDSLFADEELFF